ncbi:MAG: DUF1579 domain-containing protein [bacterium]|nr:DUF1579 domain-containing protein [bacterium]
MKVVKILIVSLLVLLFLGSGVTLTAQEQSKEEAEMMKKWQAYATPGAAHKYLEGFKGKWDVATKQWMKPGAPPNTGKGEMKAKMIMGGRYLKYSIKGPFMGMPFEGLNITAYDNLKKKFITMWIDNMGTGIYMTEGTLDKTGKIRTETGLWDDLSTGGKTKVKTVYKFVDKDKIFFEMYGSGGMHGDKEFKTMEIIFTRKMKKTKK